MRKYIHKLIRFFALLMLAGGIVLFFVCKHQAWESGIGYFTRDKDAVAMWNFLSIQCIIMAISSIFVLGFSYIVQAACMYIDKREIEEMEDECSDSEE